MPYSSGMLNKRITILNRCEAQTSKWGKDGGGVQWAEAGQVWAAVDFVKGLRAMHEGAIDVYGIVLVRMRYTDKIDLRSRIRYDGQIYNILGETFHADREANTIQFNAQIIINEK